MGLVTSVNVGRIAPLRGAGRTVDTALVKRPVDGRVAVHLLGVDGDERGEPRAHGGPDHAVYAYSAESAAWWASQLGREIEPGAVIGENLTTSGIDVDAARIGDTWTVGDDGLVLMVVGPRIACGSFSARMDDRAWADRFDAAGRPGAYLRVLSTGTVGAGDVIHVEPVTGDSPTVADVVVAMAHRDTDVARRILALDVPAEKLQSWAGRVVSG